MNSRPPVFIIDQSSFRIIYDLYYEPICRFLNYYTRDRFAIEDVVQDVFTKLWENKDYLEVRHIKTYLYNAAHNKMLNYLRNEANQAIILEQWSKEKSEASESRDCYDPDEFSELLNKFIGTLPEKCRSIFIRNKWENLSYKQIAEMNNISVKTVETQMSIALKRIRECVSAHYEKIIIVTLFSPLYKLLLYV